MNNYHRELLMEIITKWTDEQLKGYIYAQEERLENTRSLLHDLREAQRKRNKRKKKPLDTGERSGR
jgi:hypothetical protein